MNANIVKTQFFHKIKYDLKGHSRSQKTTLLFKNLLLGYLQDRLADLQDIASDQRFVKYPAQIKKTNLKEEL